MKPQFSPDFGVTETSSDLQVEAAEDPHDDNDDITQVPNLSKVLDPLEDRLKAILSLANQEFGYTYHQNGPVRDDFVSQMESRRRELLSQYAALLQSHDPEGTNQLDVISSAALKIQKLIDEYRSVMDVYAREARRSQDLQIERSPTKELV